MFRNTSRLRQDPSGDLFCTCPSYPAEKRCFHTVALQLHDGKCKLPENLDDTLVQLSARGNKPKAPGRGSVPLKADEKDLLIAHLRNKVRQMERNQVNASEVTEVVDVDDEAAPASSQLAPIKRLRTKTSQAEACEPLQHLPVEVDETFNLNPYTLNP